MTLRRSFVAAATLALVGCARPYTLVASASETPVARGAMRVRPAASWNRAPASPLLIAQEEDWTLNGPALDQLIFVGGVPDGQAIVRQRAKADQRVPPFRATMSPQDLVSMIESAYRIRADARRFDILGVAPTTLAGKPAVRIDYAYVAADEVRRRGCTVAAIVSGKLYMITLNGAASHYFAAALPEFDAVVASATLR